MKKATEIKIGSKVITPVTDSDGQLEYVTGTLVSINSRFAKVDLGDKVVNVGKSKIELVEVLKPSRKQKTTQHVTFCPECEGQELTADNGIITCDNCGAILEDDENNRIADDYEYTTVTAASGRKSVDTGDDVALTLRGETLDKAYQIVADKLEVTQKSLKARYIHLNPGHQRMCLGNLLRGWIKRNQ